jgi:hypothetical protein
MAQPVAEVSEDHGRQRAGEEGDGEGGQGGGGAVDEEVELDGGAGEGDPPGWQVRLSRPVVLRDWRKLSATAPPCSDCPGRRCCSSGAGGAVPPWRSWAVPFPVAAGSVSAAYGGLAVGVPMAGDHRLVGLGCALAQPETKHRFLAPALRRSRSKRRETALGESAAVDRKDQMGEPIALDVGGRITQPG